MRLHELGACGRVIFRSPRGGIPFKYKALSFGHLQLGGKTKKSRGGGAEE